VSFEGTVIYAGNEQCGIAIFMGNPEDPPATSDLGPDVQIE